MRSILSLLVVCLFATTGAAQFEKNAALRNDGRPPDANGRRAAEKAQPAIPGNAANPAAEIDVVGAMLAAMDADRDGVVSKIELNKAMAALRKVQKDPKGNMVVPGNAADANAAGAGLNPAQGALVGQPPGGAGATGRGNEAMALFMRADVNNDGVITPNEVPQQERNMLQGADLNRDGIINADEFQAFGRQMGERRMRAGAAGIDPNAAKGVPAVPGDGRGRRPPQQKN